MALQARRWDLVDLRVEWGADLRSADVYTVLNTYNVELYEQLRAVGYDLTGRHEMASVLGHGTTNRPLPGFVKRHRTEDTKIQQELDIALGYHVRVGNERGVNLCCANGSWGGQHPNLAPYVTLTGPTDGATAAGGRSCCRSSAGDVRGHRRDQPGRGDGAPRRAEHRAALALAHRGFVLKSGRVALSGTGMDLLASAQVREA